jgi:DNA repair protein RecN (Recombination protein N)
VDALEILLGGKVTQEHIRSGCEESCLEVLFDVEACQIAQEILRSQGIPFEENHLVIRRIVTRSGKHRAYLNDQMVTLSSLQKVGEVLVDLHGQHDHQTLLQVKYHLDHLDSFGGLSVEREAYQEGYRRFKALEEKLRLLIQQADALSQQKDDLEYQLREIEDAHLRIGEEEELKREREILQHAHQLTQWTDEAYYLLGSDEPALSQIRKALMRLREIQQIDSRFQVPVELCETALVQLEEVSQRVRDYRDHLEFDPQRLDEIDHRLYQLERLKRKIGSSLEEILERGKQIRTELLALENLSEQKEILQQACQAEMRELVNRAKALSVSRRKTAGMLENHMEKELNALRMEKCKFKVEMMTAESTEVSDFTPTGVDRIEFLISTNVGEGLKPLARVASGGELSRIMLALRTHATLMENVPTLIFDEVDAGLGGAVAEVVGEKLKSLSRSHQVLCITHLPQIASQADTHYAIEKVKNQRRTVTTATRLDHGRRIQEIARMLGGKRITSTTIEHAKEMLGSML